MRSHERWFTITNHIPLNSNDSSRAPSGHRVGARDEQHSGRALTSLAHFPSNGARTVNPQSIQIYTIQQHSRVALILRTVNASWLGNFGQIPQGHGACGENSLFQDHRSLPATPHDQSDPLTLFHLVTSEGQTRELSVEGGEMGK